jgi:hypothetical protein
MPKCKDPRLKPGEVHLTIAHADIGSYDPNVFYPGFWER